MLHIVFCYMILYFNPRSHERSDPVLSSVPLGSVPISIHAPTRGATETGAHQSNEFVFQSTLPREERPKHHGAYTGGLVISIHAPTRGATEVAAVMSAKAEFQSTLPREERLKERLLEQHEKISIHAPTRGATFGGRYLLQWK